jgi:hypothetical protein
MPLADPGRPALTQIGGRGVSLVPLEMGGFTVHASLPEPMLKIAAARGLSLAAMLAPGAAEVDFSGYYRAGPLSSALSRKPPESAERRRH